MRYLIIGLGIYGSNLATDLTDMGHEVIGADVDSSRVNAVKDYISTAYIIDSTDEQSLGVLPIKGVDLVIVAIGENFGASVKTVALLKHFGVEHIYARAIDPIHESILQGFNIDRILTPEQRAARDLAHELELGTKVDALRIDETHYVMKFKIPSYFYGLKYSGLEFEKKYGLKLVSVARLQKKTNKIGIGHMQAMVYDFGAGDAEVCEVDVITVFGSMKNFREMYRNIN